MPERELLSLMKDFQGTPRVLRAVATWLRDPEGWLASHDGHLHHCNGECLTTRKIMAQQIAAELERIAGGAK